MFWSHFDSDINEGWSLEGALMHACRTAPEEPPHRPVRTAFRLVSSRVDDERCVALQYELGVDAGVGAIGIVVTLHDARGRIVRTLRNRRGAPRADRVTWDATDAFGVPVLPGLYYARLLAGSVVRLASVWIPG